MKLIAVRTLTYEIDTDTIREEFGRKGNSDRQILKKFDTQMFCLAYAYYADHDWTWDLYVEIDGQRIALDDVLLQYERKGGQHGKEVRY